MNHMILDRRQVLKSAAAVVCGATITTATAAAAAAAGPRDPMSLAAAVLGLPDAAAYRRLFQERRDYAIAHALDLRRQDGITGAATRGHARRLWARYPDARLEEWEHAAVVFLRGPQDGARLLVPKGEGRRYAKYGAFLVACQEITPGMTPAAPCRFGLTRGEVARGLEFAGNAASVLGGLFVHSWATGDPDAYRIPGE